MTSSLNSPITTTHPWAGEQDRDASKPVRTRGAERFGPSGPALAANQAGQPLATRADVLQVTGNPDVGDQHPHMFRYGTARCLLGMDGLMSEDDRSARTGPGR